MYKRKHSQRKRYIDGFADSIARHSRSFKKGRSPKYHREVINLSLYRGRMLTKKEKQKIFGDTWFSDWYNRPSAKD